MAATSSGSTDHGETIDDIEREGWRLDNVGAPALRAEHHVNPWTAPSLAAIHTLQRFQFDPMIRRARRVNQFF